VATATNAEVEEELVLMITVMDTETFAKRLKRYVPETLLVITGDRGEIQRLAIAAGVRVLVVTGGAPLKRGIREQAAARGVSLLLSPHDTATTTMLCRGSVKVEHMIHEQFLTFREEELLSETRAIAWRTN